MGEEECEYDEQGRFYFDHDPTHFHAILTFMRSGDCVIPYERGAFEAFRRDVSYWRLDVLEARVSSELKQRTSRPFPTAITTYPLPLPLPGHTGHALHNVE